MYPASSDWKDCGMVDMILDSYTDVFNAFAKIFIAEGLSDDERASKSIEVCNGVLHKFLTIIEEQLDRQSGKSKWLVTKELTIADVAVVALTSNILQNKDGPFSVHCDRILPEFPNFSAYSKRL